MYELHHAAKRGDISRLRELLLQQEKTPDLNAFDSGGYTPLMYAVRNADAQTVRILLAAGASVHQECKASYQEGTSVLALAVGTGDPEIVATLIEGGADIHYLRNGYDILIDAVHGRDVVSDSRLLDLLRLLLARGARTDTVTSYDESVLRVLSRIGRYDAIQLLLQAGADEALLSWTSLVKTVALGTVEDLAAEIEGGASLEGRDYWERTAWLLAIQIGDVEKARLLLEKGADCHAVGRCSMPPLFYAIASRRVDMIRWLLSIGTDVEQVDEFETTPLMMAARGTNLEAVDLLLTNGAMVDRQRPKEQTALSDCSHPDIARRLLAAGADPQHLPFQARRAYSACRVTPMPIYFALPPPSSMEVRNDDLARTMRRKFLSHFGKGCFVLGSALIKPGNCSVNLIVSLRTQFGVRSDSANR